MEDCRDIFPQLSLDTSQKGGRRLANTALRLEKEREILLVHNKELQEQVKRHQGIELLLERRISMLENSLKEERLAAQSNRSPDRAVGRELPAAADTLVSHPVTHPSTPDFNSPSGSKENAEPEQPFSGGRRRMSPGFSPLGRRVKRGQGEESQPGSARRRLAQRSLMFGEASEAEGMSSRGPAGASRFPAAALDFDMGRQADGEKHAARQSVPETQDQGPVMMAIDAPTSQPLPSQNNDCSSDAAICYWLSVEPEVNEDVLGYDFPEDGEPVADSVHRGSSSLEGSGGAEVERPILAELEGIVMQSPPPSTKKTDKKRGRVDLLTEEVSRMASLEPCVKRKSPPKSHRASPVTSPMRV